MLRIFRRFKKEGTGYYKRTEIYVRTHTVYRKNGHAKYRTGKKQKKTHVNILNAYCKTKYIFSKTLNKNVIFINNTLFTPYYP